VIAYVDASALLREDGALDDLPACQTLASTKDAVARRETVVEWLEAVDLVLLQRPILARASEPFPVALGTLDALHLATALAWQDRMGKRLLMATHDRDLALAARAFGMDVRGVSSS
jgi:hypothetical protein